MTEIIINSDVGMNSKRNEWVIGSGKSMKK